MCALSVGFPDRLKSSSSSRPQVFTQFSQSNFTTRASTGSGSGSIVSLSNNG